MSVCLSPWLTDIAAAKSLLTLTHPEKVLVVVAVFGRWNGEYRFPPLKGGKREEGEGNDKKDLQKRINFKRGERERVSWGTKYYRGERRGKPP